MSKVLAFFVCFGIVVIFAMIITAIGIEADSLGVMWQLLIGALAFYSLPIVWKKIVSNEKNIKIDKQKVEISSEDENYSRYKKTLRRNYNISNEYFKKASEEIDNGNLNQGLWIKACLLFPSNNEMQKNEYILRRALSFKKKDTKIKSLRCFIALLSLVLLFFSMALTSNLFCSILPLGPDEAGALWISLIIHIIVYIFLFKKFLKRRDEKPLKKYLKILILAFILVFSIELVALFLFYSESFELGL